MPAPFNPRNLLLLGLLLIFVITFVQVGLLTIAFDKLGLSQSSAFLLLFASLGGSVINLPLFRIKADPPDPDTQPPLARFWNMRLPEYTGHTLVTLNVGGGLIPTAFSFYLLRHNPLPLAEVVFAILAVAGICYMISRPVPHIGIGMPIFVAPIAAALMAVVLEPKTSAPLAYICGTLGVLIGADLLRLKDIRRMGTPFASIGGAGTFDGVFLTGIVAVLLA